MVIKVTCYCSHEMYTVESAHVVFMVWINKVINKHLVLDALVEELEAVLPYHYRVDASVDNHEAAL